MSVLIATSGVGDSVVLQSSQYGWPAVSLAISSLLSGLLWGGFHRLMPDRMRSAGILGIFVLFGQTLDGVTTIVGIDLLGFTEQVPLSRLVLETANQLPTASVLGTAWVQLLLKIGITALLISIVRPNGDGLDGFTALALVGAGMAGLWPGINNLVLQATF
ncbi:DUF63 family protein (plasmid) [Halorientalis pallida]|uniref:DUF63 family protein n=1 Tax=Halorientalis pallida TaxID=2479928 RepID=UPI003C6EB4D7